MLLYDFRMIGNNLLAYRKKLGMTQGEVADAAGISDRTYADIERGTVNMHVETLLRICKVLHVTPDDILTDEDVELDCEQNEIIEWLNNSSPKTRATALQLLNVNLSSLT